MLHKVVLDPHPQDLRREPALATRSWQKEVVKVRSYRRSFIHTPGVLVRKRGDAGGQEGRRHWTMQVGVGWVTYERVTCKKER